MKKVKDDKNYQYDWIVINWHVTGQASIFIAI